MNFNFEFKRQFFLYFCLLFLWSCNSSELVEEHQELSIVKTYTPTTQFQETSNIFNEYWNSGLAEISSYEIQQARYGELRQGQATLIFVTEPFLPEQQVKADNFHENNLSVLKLNTVKKFYTGIYPYSLMNSVFFPVNYPQAHAIKISSSSQEWCGHTFTQLNNKNQQFEMQQYSYFQMDADTSFNLSPTHLEDELWLKIRRNPDSLPIGNFKVIPSFFYARLLHKPLQAYSAILSKENLQNDTMMAYTISYPDLNRTLTIHYTKEFPHFIESWTETYKSGWGDKAAVLTTQATKIKTVKNKYWELNSNSDSTHRIELGISSSLN